MANMGKLLQFPLQPRIKEAELALQLEDIGRQDEPNPATSKDRLANVLKLFMPVTALLDKIKKEVIP